VTRVTAYASLTSADQADILPIVDVSDTSMASTGTTKRISIASLFNSGVVYNVANTIYDGGADVTNKIDSTAAVQAAISAAGSAGGGLVTGPRGAGLKISATLEMPTGVVLWLPGLPINAQSGLSGSPVFTLATPSTTRYTTLRDIIINCNAVTGTFGVQYSNSGLSSSTPGNHLLDNLVINQPGNDGLYLDSIIETFVDKVRVFNPGRAGFNIQNGATDGRFNMCTSGASASHGFMPSGSNNHYSLCKAYYAGYNGSTFSTGHGWYMEAVPSYFSAGITFNGCEAQDCAQNGWCFDPSNGPINNISLVGCTVDSCNAVGGSGANAVGIQTNGMTYSSICGNNIFNRSGGAGAMPYYLSVNGTQTSLALGPNGYNVTNNGILYVGGSGYSLIEPPQIDLTNASLGVKLPSGASVGGVGLYAGSGAPTLSAAQGSLYLRTDGSSTSTRAYINTNGTTGWTNLTSAT
jgi:hypothetical protein